MAPVKRLSNKEKGLKQRPWITTEILEIMNERDRIHKNYTREKDPYVQNVIFAVYKKRRNQVVQQIKNSKNNYYTHVFE